MKTKIELFSIERTTGERYVLRIDPRWVPVWLAVAALVWWCWR